MSSAKRPDLHCSQHSLLLNAVSLEVKRLEREADYSPHLMPKLRMSEAISLHVCLHDGGREIFTFTFTLPGMI